MTLAESENARLDRSEPSLFGEQRKGAGDLAGRPVFAAAFLLGQLVQAVQRGLGGAKQSARGEQAEAADGNDGAAI